MTSPQQQFRRPPQHQQPPSRPHSPVIEREKTTIVPMESSGMKALRVFTYIVCSVAALVFILATFYVYDRIQAVGEALESFPTSIPTMPDLPEPPPFPEFDN